MVPGVSALGVINPGTHKEAFTAGCLLGLLLTPAPVGQLRSCSRCFPLACLRASNARESKSYYTYCIQYTILCCVLHRESAVHKLVRKALMKGWVYVNLTIRKHIY